MKFSEKGAGGESKAVRKFSKNSTILVQTGFPKGRHQILLCRFCLLGGSLTLPLKSKVVLPRLAESGKLLHLFAIQVLAPSRDISWVSGNWMAGMGLRSSPSTKKTVNLALRAGKKNNRISSPVGHIWAPFIAKIDWMCREKKSGVFVVYP